MRGDFGEDRSDNFPRFARAAGHEGRPFERAFFAAGNAAADEVQTARFQILAAALGVGEKGVAAVDNHVALFEERNELIDDRINRRAGFDHDHRLARTLQRADKFLHRARRHEYFSPSLSRRRICRSLQPSG